MNVPASRLPTYMLSKFLKNIWKVQFYLYFIGILPKNCLDGIPRMKNFHFSETQSWACGFLTLLFYGPEFFKNDPTIKIGNSHFFQNRPGQLSAQPIEGCVK